MRRIQLYIDEDLDEEIARRANHGAVPKSVLIRSALRAAFPSPRKAPDPSTRLVGAYEGEEVDSARIDDVVYRR